MTPARIQTVEAAALLGISPRALQGLAARGQIPGAAKIGKVWTFDQQKLKKFIADQEAETAARANWKPPLPAWRRRSGSEIPASPSKSEKAYELAMAKLLGRSATSGTKKLRRRG